MIPIYLDYNATTPIDPQVAEAMLPYLRDHFGNPSSSHAFGITTRNAVQSARRQVAEMIRANDSEIIFTSGGSESNNHAIKGVAFAYRHQGNHIITSAIEHPAVGEVGRYLEEKGYRVTYLPVDETGMVDPQQVKEAITDDTILITIMHANNEIGTIEPIAEITDIAHQRGILVHTDCAQSVGKIGVDVRELKVDLLSIAGHKLYAPKGVGALYVREGVRLEKLIHGAGHEMNWRAGTENVLGIVGLGKACELIHFNLSSYQEHMSQMRDQLENGLLEMGVNIRVNGHPQKRLLNTSSVSFRGFDAKSILAEMKDIAVSAGAACHGDQVAMSETLQAIHLPVEYAMGTIRFSVGRYTTSHEINMTLARIKEVLNNINP